MTIRSRHQKPPGHKARQPRGVIIASKPKPMKAKAQAKAVLLDVMFRDWEADTPAELAKRVNALRALAFCRVFSEDEMTALQAMTRKMQANMQAVRQRSN
jgi:hypothetical protein